jgi:poly-beta-1,6-N-acetyl-D-glucosamine synthase
VEIITAFFQSLYVSPTDTWFFVILGVLLLSGSYQFLYYFNRVRLQKGHAAQRPPASIIICARDAALHLEKHLIDWLSQDYPEFEVVVVDDCSADETAYLLVTEAEKHPRLKFVLLDPAVIKNGGKKLALTLGIKKAQYEHLVLTDADGIPRSDQWLKTMMSGFEEGKDIVLGVAPLQSKGLLGGLIHYENVFTALNYLGRALRGRPYMGVGRSLAYTKSIYHSVQGFSSHHHIPAGDDDLFVQSVAHSKNTAVVIEPMAFIDSKGPKDFAAYWRQKMRHLWVGKFYKAKVSLALSVLPLVNILFWLGIILYFFMSSTWLYPTLFLLVKLVPEWIIFYRKSRLLDMNIAAPYYPLWNLFHSFWYLFVGIKAFFKKRIIW